MDLIQKRGDETTTSTSTKLIRTEDEQVNVHYRPYLPVNLTTKYSDNYSWPSVHLEKDSRRLNASLEETESEFVKKLSQSLTLLEEIRVGNQTLNQTINQMSSYVNDVVDEINDSFYLLMNAFKERLDSTLELARKRSLEYILNAKEQTLAELKSLEEKIDSI